MNVNIYNGYAQWYQRERQAAIVAYYSGNTKKIQEIEEKLKLIKSYMDEEMNAA